MRRATLVAFVAALLGLAVPALAFAGNGNGRDTKTVGKDIHYGKKKVVPPTPAQEAAIQATATATTGTTPPVGTQRTWLILDDAFGRYRLASFTLKAVGPKSEVWVQDNLNFPTGDCRNDGSRNVITQPQVDYLKGQFETNMFPKESATFSVPPDRDGSHATLPSQLGLPSNYYEGESDNIVILISNVRDTNFYDTNNAHGFTYIAGFFSSQLNTFFDRNVMTVDAFDWLHRTGANPPNEPVAGDNCASKPARPFLYEGVFAHEYQHLLEYYASPGELSWVNEGLSDFAIKLTGYGQPEAPITDQRFDSHVQCFLGWLGVATPANPNPRDGGPENSLTLWSDQGDGEILCDYGAAYTFMLYLQNRFGTPFMSALHQQDLNGLAGLQATLDQFVTGETALGVIHKWAAMVAVDKALESTALRMTPNAKPLYSAADLHASINWDTANAYSTAGAPPNGSDYVRLRNASGQYLTSAQLSSLSFQGAKNLPAKPIEWTVDSGALYSGTGDLLDRAIVRQVTVPASAATLSFDTRWNLEETWDFGFVQVSTDNGASYHSVQCADGRSDYDPAAFPIVQSNVPGLTGVSDWKNETCDLSAYAGQTVYLSFRDVTDWATEGNDGASFAPGWWVKNVALGGTTIADGTSLAGWKSTTEVHPVPVNGFTVQLVGYSSTGAYATSVAQVPLDSNFSASLGVAQLRAKLGDQVDVVAAIVSYDEPTESITDYAPYTLKVNGVTQPGG